MNIHENNHAISLADLDYKCYFPREIVRTVSLQTHPHTLRVRDDGPVASTSGK